MSTQEDNLFSLSAKRLREERERLGLKQFQAADFCKVSREMWGKYERGISVPGGEVLFLFAAIGADINYILTGQRTHLISEDQPGYTLRPDQKALLDNLEHCSPQDQDHIKRMALIAAEAATRDETKPKKTNHS